VRAKRRKTPAVQYFLARVDGIDCGSSRHGPATMASVRSRTCSRSPNFAVAGSRAR
jgi:hypothetical protein